jgi:type VI secretion system protein ImpF
MSKAGACLGVAVLAGPCAPFCTYTLNMSSALRIRRGIFDRLLDSDSGAPEGLIQTCSVEQLRDTVSRDLERLLNSRSAFLTRGNDVASIGPQALASAMCFGVPDFSGRVLTSSEDQRFIATSLARAIEMHEPRLKQVAVLFQGGDLPGRALQFTIRAMLVVRPAPEGVSFDAILMPSMSRYQVTQARFAGPIYRP